MDSINKCYSTVNFLIQEKMKNLQTAEGIKYRHILMDSAGKSIYIYINR